MTNIIPAKSNSVLCSLLDRPRELQELIKINKLEIPVPSKILFASRDEMTDQVWFTTVTCNFNPKQLSEFKKLVGWIGNSQSYTRKNVKLFGYADIAALKNSSTC